MPGGGWARGGPPNPPPSPGCLSSGGLTEGIPPPPLPRRWPWGGWGGHAGAGRWPAGPPEAGGGEPAPRPPLPAVTLGGRRGPPRRAAAPSPSFIYLFVRSLIYLFRPRKEFEALPARRGVGWGGDVEGGVGGQQRRPPSERPRDFPCRRARGDPSRSPSPPGAGRMAEGGRGVRGGVGGAPAPPPRGRRGSRRCAPELLLVTPAPPPASLPLLASDSAHSQPRSLSFCKTQFTQQRASGGAGEVERGRRRGGAQSRNPAWLRGTFTR